MGVLLMGLRTGLVAGIAGIALVAPAGAAAAPVAGDFNADGADDLAVASPYESVGSVKSAGAVNVIFGDAGDGLTPDFSQIWHRRSPGVAGDAHVEDYFGTALAAGDFDDDGYDDLAIGVWGEGNGDGAVQVLPGDADGLTTTGSHLIDQATAGVPDSPKSGHFGAGLAAADFDGDGVDDLAAGAPYQPVRRTPRGIAAIAGTVTFLLGEAGTGLTGEGALRFSQGTAGMPGTPQRFDYFGVSLAAGDLDGTGGADLAVGISGQDVEGQDEAGALAVIYAGNDGPSAANSELLDRSSSGVSGQPAKFDHLGARVATGQINGEAGDEIAASSASATQVIYDIASPSIGTDDAYLPLAGQGGGGVAVADFDDDGFEDLAAGDRFAVVNGQRAGRVRVFRGSDTGLSARGFTTLSQGAVGASDVPGVPEDADNFGQELTSGDYDALNGADLSVGAPSETAAGLPEAGAVNAFHSTGSGLGHGLNQVWTQDSPGIPGVVEAVDRFGDTLG
jgi:hypothetical protein